MKSEKYYFCSRCNNVYEKWELTFHSSGRCYCERCERENEMVHEQLQKDHSSDNRKDKEI